jgi:hypothetical protein
MLKASAEPPISTKPPRMGWSLRKFQTCSVAGGSTGKPLLDVAQGTLDRRLGALDLACAILS